MPQPIAAIGASVDHRTLRAWAYDEGGNCVASHAATFEAAASVDACCAQVRFHLGEWLGAIPEAPVIVSGLARYPGGADCPGLLPLSFRLEQLPERLIACHGLHLVPGLVQKFPPDYVSGPEAMLFAIEDIGERACIPGQCSTHVTIDHGRILDISTELTMQLRDAVCIAERSWKPAAGQDFDEAIFCEWVDRSLDPDDAVSPFAAEAACVLGALPENLYACALDGLMIGAEIAAHYDPGDEVTLIGDGNLADRYRMALETLAVDVTSYSAEECLRDGLFELADLAGLLEDEQGLS